MLFGNKFVILLRDMLTFNFDKIKHVVFDRQTCLDIILICVCRDLSSTAIKILPVDGLAEIEVLKVQDTTSLKVFPSIYNFKVSILLVANIYKKSSKTFTFKVIII